jgi:hypothetical protein
MAFKTPLHRRSHGFDHRVEPQSEGAKYGVAGQKINRREKKMGGTSQPVPPINC